ncbi:MAG: hypothetical protein HY040_19210 [Planctomycetes bacterium]|nr:hypothetical protein [Planctomycetota bacterium]
MTDRSRSGLLVSVRSVEEADAALAGGAALIDVKEPAHGSLGRADAAVIAAVARRVAGRQPVSAALGELCDFDGIIPQGLAYVKCGLANCRRESWRSFLQDQWRRTEPPLAVAVAYADWQCAVAPPLDEVASFAQERPGSVLLIDTHCKDSATPDRSGRPTLLDWVSVAEVVDLCASCRCAGVRVALAGSLGLKEIAVLRSAAPDWFAVRGAVCSGGLREGAVVADKVRALADLIAAPFAS